MKRTSVPRLVPSPQLVPGPSLVPVLRPYRIGALFCCLSHIPVKTSSEGFDLGTSVFLDMVPDASGTDERHPRWIGFIHRFEKRVDNLYFVVRAKRTQVETHQKGGSQSIVLERGIYHYVRKKPLAVSFILHKETSYVIQVLDSPLRIVHERDDFQQHQRRR